MAITEMVNRDQGETQLSVLTTEERYREIVELDKQIYRLENEEDRAKAAVNEVKNKIKSLKSEKNEKLTSLYGGQIVVAPVECSEEEATAADLLESIEVDVDGEDIADELEKLNDFPDEKNEEGEEEAVAEESEPEALPSDLPVEEFDPTAYSKSVSQLRRAK